jgi:streptogramin lyase
VNRRLTAIAIAALALLPAAAAAAPVTELTAGTTPGFSANASPSQLAVDRQGRLWFTDSSQPGRVGYVDGAGTVHELVGGVTPGFSANSAPYGITVASDGRIWFTEVSGGLAFVDALGTVHEIPAGVDGGLRANALPAGIAEAPDGNIWFTEDGNGGGIGYFDGVRVHEFLFKAIGRFSPNGNPQGIVPGPDGRIWFAEDYASPGAIAYTRIGSDGQEFLAGQTPGFDPGRGPFNVVTAPDGRIWFTEAGDPGGVAYIDDSGTVHQLVGGVTPGFSAGRTPIGIAVGPGGRIWFAERDGPGAVAYIDDRGTVHELDGGTTPGFSARRRPVHVLMGADGHIWFTEIDGRIGRVTGTQAATGAADGVGSTSAALHGSLNPNGFPVSDCHFEYGTTTSYGTSAPCAQRVGDGLTSVAVSASLGRLAPGTTYHYRLVGAGDAGSGSGADRTFATAAPGSAPFVLGKTRLRSSRTAVTVQLSNPNGFELRATVSAKTASPVAARKRIVSLKTKRVRVAPHATKSLKLGLPGGLRRLLARGRHVPLRVTIRLQDPSGSSHTVRKSLRL